MRTSPARAIRSVLPAIATSSERASQAAKPAGAALTWSKQERMSKRAAGIPLEQIRAALETLPSTRTPTRRDWERLSHSWRTDIDRRIATLQALRERLTTCIGCGCLSIDRCTLLNPQDEVATLGPGAHYLHRDSRRTTAT